MPGGDKKWDITAERDLCLAIILGNAENEKVRHNWPRVHAFMGELGYDFTKDAVSQHFTKAIMRDFKKRHGANGSPAATPKKLTPRATPRKRGRPAKRKVESSDEEPDDSDESGEKKETPSKRVKQENKVKDEEEHERRARERSATIADNDAKFENWLNSGA